MKVVLWSYYFDTIKLLFTKNGLLLHVRINGMRKNYDLTRGEAESLRDALTKYLEESE
jgi:hypothetical protein